MNVQEFKLMQENHITLLKETTAAARLKNKWIGSKFECFKEASLSDKGTAGEKFTVDILNTLVFDSEIVDGGIGPFDIRIIKYQKTLEHKLATMDVHGSFQFNGIKKDTKFDYVYCLGVSPNKMFFTLMTYDDAQKLTTPMSGKGSDSFKFTTKPSKMLPLTLDNVRNEVLKIV